jgi:DNA modification methylase
MVAETESLYRTRFGKAFVGDALVLLQALPDSSIDLVLTSPPFALRRQKTYGNVEESNYVNWLKPFAEQVFRVLKDSGSFVLDLGGAYRQGVPSRSLYNFRVLLSLCDDVGFQLAEDFYWFNPAKLPSPIEWVNKRKIRAKDSVDTIWWLSKTEWPKADLTSVLQPYSERMKKLISDPKSFYTPKKRPSGHDISANFGKNNGGAIPSNLISASNTDSNSSYFRMCKEFDFDMHPARFPEDIPRFFIKMLTDPDDIVLDIFAGSNTTGAVAESLERLWLAFEENHEYLITSALRFLQNTELANAKATLAKLVNIKANVFLSTTPTLLSAAG